MGMSDGVGGECHRQTPQPPKTQAPKRHLTKTNKCHNRFIYRWALNSGSVTHGLERHQVDIDQIMASEMYVAPQIYSTTF